MKKTNYQNDIGRAEQGFHPAEISILLISMAFPWSAKCRKTRKS